MQRTDWESTVSLEAAGKSIRLSLDHQNLGAIRCNLTFIDLLRQEVARNSDESEEEREVGGLLFGTLEEKPNAERCANLDVNLFVPVPCSYHSGYFYRLSETDKGQLQDSIPEWIQYSRWSVVGVYRSHRRPDLQLDHEDRNFAATYLTNPAHIFFLIEPDAKDEAAGHLFVRGDGNFSESPILSFPFDRQRLAAGTEYSPRHENGVVSAQYDHRVAALTGELNATGDEAVNGTTKIGWRRAYLWGAAACILGLLVFAFVRSTVQTNRNYAPQTRLPSASARAAGALGLKAFTEPDQIRLEWDPNAPPVASAASGSLVIKDGLFQNVIHLDSLTLRHGTVRYFPLTSSVSFELQVGSAADFVAVTGISEKTKLSWRASPVSPPVASSTNQPLPQTPPTLGKLTAAQTRPLRPAPSPISELIPPPDLNPAPHPVASSLQQLPIPALPGPLLPQPKEQILYLAPQSVTRVSPKAPANVSRLLISLVTIRVKIEIDRGGKVVRAESLSRGSALLDYLSTLSVNAAQKWLFRPAQRGDQAVESETVLEFNFSPNGSLPRQ